MIAAQTSRIEKLPFQEIPQQTRLFLDYLKNPQNLIGFYGAVAESHADLIERVPTVLTNYQTDRDKLADALKSQNKSWHAAPLTLANIERLREKDAVVVVTGQQAGLFTGALYTIYKALSVVKTAAELRAQNVNAVPVFWIASEDHDFAEVAEVFALNRNGGLSEITIQTAPENEGLPVGKIMLDDSIKTALDDFFSELPKTEFSAEAAKLINECYRPNVSLSAAFASLMARLFADYGLIMLDPLDAELKSLAAPIYESAVRHSGEIVTALVNRSQELAKSGYHAQILVEKDSFPLFLIDDEGRRRSLKTHDGKIRSQTGKEFALAELLEIARTQPERLSPNATLRATVQDYLLPTLCYFGGAAEVAYFAQTSEVYRILERPPTPIFHRASVTVVAAGARRTMEKYDLHLPDFFAPPETLYAKIAERYLNSDTAQTFVETEKEISDLLDRLYQSLELVEPTLAESLTKRRRKIVWHVETLRKKFHRAAINKNAVVSNQLETANAALYPRHGLQERTVNVASLLARHGTNFVSWLYERIEANERAHQIIYL